MALTEHADDLCVVLCMRRLGTRGCYCWKFGLALLHGARTTCVGNEKWDQISYTPKLYALLFWIWSPGFLWFVWELEKWTRLWELYLWAKMLKTKQGKKTHIHKMQWMLMEKYFWFIGCWSCCLNSLASAVIAVGWCCGFSTSEAEALRRKSQDGSFSV